MDALHKSDHSERSTNMHLWDFNCSPSFLLTICDRITVRQTIDPYVNNIQYIASHEVLLEHDGSLSMSKIGLGLPGDNFVVRHKSILDICLANGCLQIISRKEQPGNPFPVVTVFTPPSDILRPDHIRMMASCEDGPHPILTVVGKICSSPHSSVSEIFLQRVVMTPLGLSAIKGGSTPGNVKSSLHI